MQKIKGDFYQKSIISVDQFEKEDIKHLFQLAHWYKKAIKNKTVLSDLHGKILTALFYEPSSRTFASHISAMQRLGGSCIPIQGVTFSSVSKGETLIDTVRVFSCYSDILVLRHSKKGSAKIAAKYASVPVINAGDGVGEHPTQALLDLFTIYEKLGRTDDLTIAMVGDLKYGRTVHSLSKLLSLYKNITIYFVCPQSSPMPSSIVTKIEKRGVKTKTYSAIEDIIKKVDVIYMTRVQKERMNKKLYHKIKNLFVLDKKLSEKMKKYAIIMHPLPRISEIPVDVDKNHRSVYFSDQITNGMLIRMALLKKILSR